MVGVNLQDAAPFVNPKNVVGANSAGPLQTATFPNFAEPPEIFGNNKVFLTNNMYPGTSNKVGGKRRSKSRRTKKRRGSKRSNAGMHKKRSSSSHSRKRSSSRKKSSSPHAAPGECRYCDYGDEGEHKQSPSNLCKECKHYARERGLLRGGRSYKKRKSPKRKGKKSKRHSKRGGMGCKTKRHHHHSHSKKKRKHSKRGGMGCKSKKPHRHGKKKGKHSKRGGCTHLLGKTSRGQDGGSGKQLEMSSGYSFDGNSNTLGGALAAPMPRKVISTCGLKPRN